MDQHAKLHAVQSVKLWPARFYFADPQAHTQAPRSEIRARGGDIRIDFSIRHSTYATRTRLGPLFRWVRARSGGAPRLHCLGTWSRQGLVGLWVHHVDLAVIDSRNRSDSTNCGNHKSQPYCTYEPEDD